MAPLIRYGAAAVTAALLVYALKARARVFFLAFSPATDQERLAQQAAGPRSLPVASRP